MELVSGLSPNRPMLQLAQIFAIRRKLTLGLSVAAQKLLLDDPLFSRGATPRRGHSLQRQTQESDRRLFCGSFDR